MIEKIVNRDGEKVTEIRSEAGKLLLVKTKKGYEIKCPRTKTICLIKYEEMISDCLACCDAELLNNIKKRV
jgi:phage FluMu protein Com